MGGPLPAETYTNEAVAAGPGNGGHFDLPLGNGTTRAMPFHSSLTSHNQTVQNSFDCRGGAE